MRTVLPALLVSPFLLHLKVIAQDEAVPTFSTNGLQVTYVNNLSGAGYEFSPKVEIAVTALGFGGIDLENYPYQVSLYSIGGWGQTPITAMAEVTTSSTFYNQTYYQNITPVDLFPGQNYYIYASAIGNSHWSGFVTGPLAQDDGSFSINPDINYEAADDDFTNGTNGDPMNALPLQIFFVDENFQFVVVPEPSVLCLSATGLAGMIWYRRWLRRGDCRGSL